jgi:hypothetical protein
MNFVLRDGERLCWGGCAWDSFGIAAATGADPEILTTCPGCGADLRYRAGPTDLVARVPRPAAEWWDDVVATCTEIRAFCSAEHVDDYTHSSGKPAGATIELDRLYNLALPWYGDRLDPDWEPQTQEHRQRLLEEAGLTGPFWQLP